MKKAIKIIFILVLIGSLGFLGFFVYQKTDNPTQTFETDSTFVTNIEKKTVATGSINPRKEIEIKSQVSGVVDKLFVEAGDNIKAGQLIAKIKIIPDVVALNNAEANLKEAVINFKNAEKELTRQKKLFHEKVISEFEYNQYLLTYNLNNQQVDAAENNLQLIKEGASKKSGAVSNLVRSTVSGMVLDVPVKEGNFVIETNTFNDGTTIASVANMNEMVFEGKVDEAEVGKLVEGMALKLTVGALDSVEFIANLEYISPKGKEEEGAIQFEVRAAITLQSDQFLRAGYSANADIVLERKNDVLAIKESNLFFEKKKVFVEVLIEGEKFERREIKTGISDGINIEVLSGLTSEDKVKQI
ncbi:efflux RND transporter periplasmic adaptor subunit [Fulvivirgaceae bacterium BMA12]|uniref:Efflux RND transporter periplasmic adaptor subunit n=1 Tax=Agaribacillus aureus TaxID=3051825 RepID=A0ABT8LG53_9BACT|nr:efflux RND transporter periplasmic adaptor subunit [Fulvivirgaceae bacterium BMA12]